MSNTDLLEVWVNGVPITRKPETTVHHLGRDRIVWFAVETPNTLTLHWEPPFTDDEIARMKADETQQYRVNTNYVGEC